MLSLENKYSPAGSDNLSAFSNAFIRYIRRKRETLADITIVAASLSADILLAPNPDPLAVKAIQDTNPSFDPDSLSGHSSEELTGMVNAAKGKYFEYLVADRLNNGEVVGDVSLPEGYKAVLADSMNQPGWDLQIVDEQNNTVDYLQLKATESTSYIHEALTRYPEIQILTTDEVANAGASTSNLVLDSNMSDQDLTRAVESAIGNHADSLGERVWDHFHPLWALLFIAGTEGYKVVVQKEDLKRSIDRGSNRTARALVSSSTSSLAYALGGGWFSLTVAYLSGLMYDRYRNYELMYYSTKDAILSLEQFHAYRNRKLIPKE